MIDKLNNYIYNTITFERGINLLVFINPKLYTYSLSRLNYLYFLNREASVDKVRCRRLSEYDIDDKDMDSIINAETTIIEKRVKEGTLSIDDFKRKKTYEQLSDMLIKCTIYKDTKVECDVARLLNSEIVDLYNFCLYIENEYRKIARSTRSKYNQNKMQKYGLTHGQFLGCDTIITQITATLEESFFDRFNGPNSRVSNIILPSEQSFVKQEPLKKKIRNNSLVLVKQIVNKKKA